MITLEEHLQIYINGDPMDDIMRGTLDILRMSIYVNNNFMDNILYLMEVADFSTWQSIPNRTTQCYSTTASIRLAVLRNVENEIGTVYCHTKSGFQVNDYHADNEVNNIEADIVPSTLHTQALGAHEPTSESSIRTIKHRTSSMLHSVP